MLSQESCLSWTPESLLEMVRSLRLPRWWPWLWLFFDFPWLGVWSIINGYARCLAAAKTMPKHLSVELLSSNLLWKVLGVSFGVLQALQVFLSYDIRSHWMSESSRISRWWGPQRDTRESGTLDGRWPWQVGGAAKWGSSPGVFTFPQVLVEVVNAVCFEIQFDWIFLLMLLMSLH